MKKYILYLDDTGFNTSDKSSERLKSERGTYAGVLVPEEHKERLEEVMNGLCAMLYDFHGTDEFHFTEIYNRKNPFENIKIEETLDMLEAFSNIFNNFELKISVFTALSELPTVGDKLLKTAVENSLKMLNLPRNDKTYAMMLCYMTAKMHLDKVKKDGEIVEIVADEGVRKPGTVIGDKNKGFCLTFASSKENKLLQLADYAAWFITRAKNILEKANKTKKISETDIKVLEIYSKLSNNYIGFPQKRIDLANLKDFDYDKMIAEGKKQIEEGDARWQ